MAKFRICRSVRSGHGATPERKRQQGGVVREVVDRDARGGVLIERHKAISECLLDGYYKVYGKISEEEHRVGIKFRHAYMRAVLKIQVEDIGSGNHGSHDMGALLPIHSEKILREAYSVLSLQQKMVVIGVCGHDDRPRDKDHFETFRRGLDVLTELWDTAGGIGYK